MCVIIIKPANVVINEEKLRNCFKANSDGAGLAVNTENGILLRKGFMTEEEFIKAVRQFVTVEAPAILHCRIATHGAKDAGNTHPFIVHKDIEKLRQTEGLITDHLIMAHNGVFIRTLPAVGETVLSDTQEFIRKILYDKYVMNGIWTSESVKLLFKEFIGTNRVALMHPKKGILYFGNFEEEDGILYSNTSYITKVYKTTIYDRRFLHDSLPLFPNNTLYNTDNKSAYCSLCEEFSFDVKSLYGVDLCAECYKALNTVQEAQVVV